jgi:hypothetical protein
MSCAKRSAFVGNDSLRALLAIALVVIFGLAFYANRSPASKQSKPTDLSERTSAAEPAANRETTKTDSAERPEPVQFACQWSASPITIDGRADEPAWQGAVLIDDFLMPVSLKKPRRATRARLLWDADNLYFTADMDDSDLYADITEHDGETWSNDVFELFFKPRLDQPAYYELQVNAAGTQMDMFLPCRGGGSFQRFAKLDKFDWQTATALRGTLNDYSDTDEGWTVEGRLPWSDFRHTGGAPKPGDTWGFSLCRYDYSVPFEGMDLSSSSRLSQVNFHLYEDYARLRFVAAKNADNNVGNEKAEPARE